MYMIKHDVIQNRGNGGYGQESESVSNVLQKRLRDKGIIDRKLVGQIGESSAVFYLKNKGYRIVGRNIRFSRGEVDILALKDGVVRLVEVKAGLSRFVRSRKTNVSPETNFSTRKISKLKSIAQEIVSSYPFPFNYLLDFDVKNGTESMILRDSDDISVQIEGVAIVINIRKNTVDSVNVRHYESIE
jgi:Holliday junction resolvase-like predicted endonuclease